MLVALFGPTGVGKSYLVSKLVEDGKLDITALNNYLFDKELIISGNVDSCINWFDVVVNKKAYEII